MTLRDVATKHIGKTEKPKNSGFKDVEFEKRMKAVGWLTGQAWCSYFAELCVIEWAKAAGRPDIVKLAGEIFSGSSTATYKNADIYAKANPNGILKVSKDPTPSSIAIYRQGNTWKGHTAIVIDITPDGHVMNVEGNTNDQGGREGYIVAKKKRRIKAPLTTSGLNIVGYISFL
jgi:hypothetical protein